MFFLLFGPGPRPCLNSKKNTTYPNSQKKKPPARTAKNNTPTPAPFLIAPLRSLIFSRNVRGRFTKEGVFLFAVWAGGEEGAGIFYFLLFGLGACFICCCLGGRVFHFLLFGRGACFSLPFGRGRVCFFAVWAGTGVHSLTGLPGWASKGLTTKRPNSKSNTGSVYKCTP